ncbi:hypothetical protein CBER1_10322 [Cercospora berteroae]|uniref:F-box domain-containing protein n=1 Tax=Cercospora berteroae TaxID=357750 RepID=A0A2S6CHQ8_9PEZI|nr:hypothetical protein CBER1_10322 [Cercospora berteroae]
MKAMKRKAQKLASSSKMSAQVDESKTSFLDLPAELRNEIYRLCLLAPEVMAVTRPPWQCKLRICQISTFPRRRRDKLYAPGLLRSCKQISHEAISILYGEDVLDFEGTRVAHAFLLHVAHTVKHIRYMIVGSGNSSKTSFARFLVALKGAVRLRKLTLDFDVDYLNGGSGLGMGLCNVDEAAKVLGPLMRLLWKQRKPTKKKDVLDIVHWVADQWYFEPEQQRYNEEAADYEARVKALLEKTLK